MHTRFSIADFVISKACPGEQVLFVVPITGCELGEGRERVGGLEVTKKIDRSHGENRRLHSLRRAPSNSKPRVRPFGKKLSAFQKNSAPP
jgi:hypothetical protein